MMPPKKEDVGRVSLITKDWELYHTGLKLDKAIT